jgi:predicted ATP-grasp superfamily ATP-dependent carboligase
MPLTVFVTDGNERPALAIVRALGRRGISVLVGHDQSVSLASSSKYCARQITYPSPHQDRAAFDRFLIDFLSRERIDVVMPVTDVTTHAVCANQDAVRQHSAIAAPPLEAFEFVSNKGALIGRAAQCGVPVPPTHFVAGFGALLDVVGNVQYPAVIKPVRSRIPTNGGWRAATVHYARSEAELRQIYRDTPYLCTHPSLIQQRIVGAGVGVFLLFDRGRLVAEFAHRRLREKPPAGGVSVLRESTAVDPRLRAYANRILGPIGWHGAVMMEYKEDHRTGELFLMEVNGRFWGSLQLAIDAGIDFPHLVCELALGHAPTAVPSYQTGVKSRWLLGDLDHLCLRLFKSDRELQLPPLAASRLRTCVEFMKFVQPKLHYEVACRDDLHPFLYELGQSARGLSASASRFVRRRVRRGEHADASAEVISHVR